MAPFIDIHVLQYLPLSCVNRDDAGLPKTVMLSGVRRTRWSSQSQKHVLRGVLRERLDAGQVTDRTRRLPMLVLDELVTGGMDVQEAREAVTVLIAEPLGKDATPQDSDDQNGKKSKAQKEQDAKTADIITSIVIPVTAGAPSRVAAAIRDGELSTDLDKKAKKAVLGRYLSDVTSDVALAGRFIADVDRTDGALSVAHGVGTAADGFVAEFWTAVDDLAGENSHGGSALMGTQGLTSGVIYRYATVDMAELRANLNTALGDDALAQAAATDLAGTFLREFARLRPEAMKRSSAPFTEPSLVQIDVTDRPRSLVTAFSRPVSGPDVVDASVQALVEHDETVTDLYGGARHSERVSTVDGQWGKVSLDDAIAATLTEVA